ncbi:hypothetical protein ACUXPF_000783 [Sphingomonas sanguinis]
MRNENCRGQSRLTPQALVTNHEILRPQPTIELQGFSRVIRFPTSDCACFKDKAR